MKKNKNVSNRGAPKKRDDEKIGDNGMREDQNERLKQVAESRGVSIASIKREAVDWYLLSLEEAEKKEEMEKISREA